jgi:hypothetical protein
MDHRRSCEKPHGARSDFGTLKGGDQFRGLLDRERRSFSRPGMPAEKIPLVDPQIEKARTGPGAERHMELLPCALRDDGDRNIARLRRRTGEAI